MESGYRLIYAGLYWWRAGYCDRGSEERYGEAPRLSIGIGIDDACKGELHSQGWALRILTVSTECLCFHNTNCSMLLVGVRLR